MRNITVTVLLTCLAGCATEKPGNGNFIQAEPTAYSAKLVSDSVQQLVKVFPPAKTRFDLAQPTPDAFGTMLVASLRGKGYALREFDAAPAAKAKESEPLITFRYTVDQLGEFNLYRVTLLVGDQSLTRAYQARNGALLPAGSWMHKEQSQ